MCSGICLLEDNLPASQLVAGQAKLGANSETDRVAAERESSIFVFTFYDRPGYYSQLGVV